MTTIFSILKNLIDGVIKLGMQIDAEGANKWPYLIKSFTAPNSAEDISFYFHVICGEDIIRPPGETLTRMCVRRLIQYMLDFLKAIRDEPSDLAGVILMYDFLDRVYYRMWDSIYGEAREPCAGLADSTDEDENVYIDVDSVDLSKITAAFQETDSASSAFQETDSAGSAFQETDSTDLKEFISSLYCIIKDTKIKVPEELLSNPKLTELYRNYSRIEKPPLDHERVLRTFKSILYLISKDADMLGASCWDLFSEAELESFGDVGRRLLSD